MEHRFDNGTLTVQLKGRLDSLSAPVIQAELEELLSEYEVKTMIMDLDELKYVASAGLRVFLSLKKRVGDFSAVNVPSEIFEIFEMTGFTEIMSVTKAYRRLPVEICEVIGKGAHGTIYRVNPEMIVKTAHNGSSLADIDRERELARRAFVLGIPTAISYDIVRIGSGYGAVYELLNAETVANILRADIGKMDECASLCAELTRVIHATSAKPGEMPSAKDALTKHLKTASAALDEKTAAKITSLVAAIPEDTHVLHGDCHIKNVMVQNGEALLIDMETLCCGHPVIELGYLYNAYRGYVELDEKEGTEFIGLSAQDAARFWEKFLSLYLGTNDKAAMAEVENKARVVSYIRLLSHVLRHTGAEAGSGQIKYLKEKLAELARSTDKLTW